MDDKGGENPGPLGVQGWELAKLIGNYERFTQDVDSKLTRIEERLEKGQESFNEINSTMAAKTEKLDNLENRVTEFEDNGLSRRRRLQIDGTTLAAVALALKEIVVTLIKAFQ